MCLRALRLALVSALFLTLACTVGTQIVLAQGTDGQSTAGSQENAADDGRLRWPSAWPSTVKEDGSTKSEPGEEPVVGQSTAPKNSQPGPSEGAVHSDPSGVAPPSNTGQPGTGPQTQSKEPQADGLGGQPAATNNSGQGKTSAGGVAQPVQQEAGTADAAKTPSSTPAAPTSAPKGAAESVPAPPVQLTSEIAQQIEASKGHASRLDAIEKSVERLSERDDELTQQLPKIDGIIADAANAAENLRPQLADVRSQIEKLGDAPENGKSESQDVAATRQRLNAVAAEIDGAIKTAELTEVRARQLITRIQDLRLENFRRSLFQRSPSLLSPGLWYEATAALPDAARQLRAVAANWWSRARLQSGAVLGLFIAAILVWAGLWLLAVRVRQKLRTPLGEGEAPSFSQKVLSASVDAPLRLAPAVAGVGVAYLGLESLGLLYLQTEKLALAIFSSVAVVAGGWAFAASYLAPNMGNWRVVPVGDLVAGRVCSLIRLAALLFGADVLVRGTINELFLPLPVSIVWSGLVAAMFAVLFIAGARVKPQIQDAPGGRLSYFAERAHKVPLLASTLVIIVGVLTGYIALAHFAASRFLIIATAIALLALFYIANRAIAALPEEDSSSDAATASTAVSHPGMEAGMPPMLRRRLARGTSIVLDIVLFVFAVPFLLLAAGIAPEEITTLGNRALFGFEVGGIEISLARIGFAVALFAAILFASRLMQNWLGETILHPSRTEQGLGNSIRTGVGYIGFFIAALVGLSYAGLDITNLAIVAGALSVGIGFGLQSIVNNFVSGLILLVERPIKVGDWIKVGDQQGHVRRISVRSTEIETFERASVIIPNSELISGTVTNLTLRNALGRISIPVGVSYDADPDQVQEILLACAAECKAVARHPAPFVVFEDFGPSSLDFSLRFFVPDVNTSLSTQTAVRKAIMQKFKAAGIEIPFPQRVVSVRETGLSAPHLTSPGGGEETGERVSAGAAAEIPPMTPPRRPSGGD